MVLRLDAAFLFSMQRAPLDFLAEDEALDAATLARARADAAEWTEEHAWALLPYSFCVMESLTEAQVQRLERGDSAPKHTILA